MSLSGEGAPLAEFSPVEPLRPDHVLDGFDCGHAELNTWLTKYAVQNQGAGGARTLVVSSDGRVVGYYALAAGAVVKQEASARIGKGMAAHPIPVIVPARLAVDRTMKKQGLGRALLKDALLRILEVSEVVGVRAVLVHAKHDEARSFYMDRADFEPSPLDPLQLLLLIKDLKASLGA